MGYQIVFSPSARRDLHAIVRYISYDSPEHARRFGEFLLDRTKMLAQHPEMGRMVPEFGDSSLRELILRSYRVVYRVHSSASRVEVVRFWHAARGTPEISQ